MLGEGQTVRKTPFYHLHLNNLNSQEALDFCWSCFQAPSARTIFFINAHCFNISREDDVYRQALNDSDLVLNDGIGVKIASRLVNVDIKENMNGTDFIPKLLALSAANDKSVYLIGARPGIAEAAREKLQQRFRGLDIRGVASGYFSTRDEDEVIDRINRSQAEVIVVGMGVPFQEKWIIRNRHKFDHARIIIAGGAIIDFSAGRVKRAPKLVRAVGLEWLFRFAQEPRRLFRRYFIGNWIFLQHIAAARFGSNR